jgi:RNA polymerase sigma factor (sigma-70 family)
METSKQDGLNDYARNLIRHKARKLIGSSGFTWDDYEDLMQEMALDLLIRLPKFDRNKASFNTFAVRIVDRRISTLIRHRTQGMRDYSSEAWSLDEPIDELNSAGASRSDALSQDEHDLRTGKHCRPESERIDMRLEVSLVLSELPPDLKELAERLCHQSVTEAARDLGVPRGTLYGTGIARLRKAFEDKGLREYL